MNISPAILINKKCHSHQRFLDSKYEWELPILWSSRCCHSSMETVELGECKKQGEQVGPRQLKCIWKEWICWGLHVPVHRILTSLTWYLIFDVQTAGSLGGKLVHSLTSPLASLEQLSQSHWDAISWAQASWTFPPKKTALFSDCDFIF